LFLVVAAFLLNVVVSRIVSGQREQIAAMKAFGYRDREVGLHYAKLVGLVTLGGCVLGTLFATWMGAAMTRLYADYYRFPELPFRMSSRELIEGIAMSCIAAAVGTRSAIRRTIALPPAEAMRPEPPASYRKTIIERLGVAHYLPTAARVVLRELERRPGRAAFSIFGIAMAAALTIVNSFTFDSVKHMLNVQFGLNQREDVQLTLVEPRSIKVLAELRQLPGVLHAEPFRAVAVRMSSGHREKTTSISGVPIDASLTTLLDRELRNVPLPPDGVVLARKLAEALDVSTGDSIRMEILEGARPVVTARVARIVETFIGIGAHMNLPALCRLLGETETLNGAWLLVDDARLDELNAAVKARPIIAGVTSRDSVLRQVREMLDGNLLALVGISLGFSLVMAFGVLYNAVRITLSERARDLASLRVLGYRRGEVATILLGEIGLLILVALPLGLLIGRALAGVLVTSPGFDTEQFRLPLVITPMTYVSAVLTVLAAALVSSWTAWRRLDQIDLVEVLKTRD
jgi:putative ABC transport system permease protein